MLGLSANVTSAHVEVPSKYEREPPNPEATKAPNGAAASLAQWRKPWGSRNHFGLDSPIVGGRMAGVGELCRPIRGYRLLLGAIVPRAYAAGLCDYRPFRG